MSDSPVIHLVVGHPSLNPPEYTPSASSNFSPRSKMCLSKATFGCGKTRNVEFIGADHQTHGICDGLVPEAPGIYLGQVKLGCTMCLTCRAIGPAAAFVQHQKDVEARASSGERRLAATGGDQ